MLLLFSSCCRCCCLGSGAFRAALPLPWRERTEERRGRTVFYYVSSGCAAWQHQPARTRRDVVSRRVASRCRARCVVARRSNDERTKDGRSVFFCSIIIGPLARRSGVHGRIFFAVCQRAAASLALVVRPLSLLAGRLLFAHWPTAALFISCIPLLAPFAPARVLDRISPTIGDCCSHKRSFRTSTPPPLGRAVTLY